MVGLSARGSIIRGLVTIDSGCGLENLTVINQADSANDIIAVIIQNTSGTAWSRLLDCSLFGYNCGNGAGIGVYIDSVDVYAVCERGVIVGDSKSGVGYSFSNDGGEMQVYHSRYYAKTEVFHDV
jgi:hypothetical protein